jgi:hypothetical protein
MPNLIDRISAFLNPAAASPLGSVSSIVDDSPGYTALTGRPHDYDPARLQEIYADALEAWRKNPMAWRAVAITTDYIVGDAINISSPVRSLNKFIKDFWSHPKNNMAIRVSSMSDELARSGDLFVLLFRNPQDGMSYIRFITKDRINKIDTASNDWETELAYHEISEIGEPKVWLSPSHPDSSSGDSICLHYSINRPVGALLGESDLITMLPWLQRYSRMLEDRVRLNWAVRAFLWIVTVPSNRVKEKQEQYRTPPEAGSIIIKDDSETWDVNTPLLRGADAAKDLQAVRGMVDSGSGYPPHWRGDAGDISLATAQAMQGPTERHLRRRQAHFLWILQDILYHAYQRAVEIGMSSSIPRTTGGRPTSSYDDVFHVHIPEISRWDNESLAKAARDITQAFFSLSSQLAQLPDSYLRLILSISLKFAGEPVSEEVMDQLVKDLKESPPALAQPFPPPSDQKNKKEEGE